MRPLRRKLASRKTLRRVSPPTVVGSRPLAAPPPVWRMRCMCGAILEIPAEDDGMRRSCPTCSRRFDIRFSEELQGGQRGVSLLYLTDNKASGETSTVGGGTTSFQLPVPDPSAATHGLLLEPESPEEAHFKCACKAVLAISRAQYEKRARCPACGARMLVFLLYDASKKTFTLQTFSLIDKSSGMTQLLAKL